MPETTQPKHIAEFAGIIRRLIRIRSRIKTLMPEQDREAADILARLMESHPQGEKASRSDYDLLYDVGSILSERHEPMTMSDLSQGLNVPISTATRIIDWMVKGQFVSRLSDPSDRRVVRVTLSPLGLAMYQSGNNIIRKRAEMLLSVFTAAERETLIALLGKLVTTLENRA